RGTTNAQVQGHSRRRFRGSARRFRRSGGLLLGGNAVAAAALGLPLLVAYLLDRALPAQLFNSTEVLASCLFACTGLLCLVRWRLLGHAQAAYTGCCFLAFGLLTVPLPLVAVLLTDGGRVELIAPLARGAAAVCALTCAARGLRSSQVDARVRPRHLLAQTLGLSAGLYVIVAAVLVTLGHRVRTPVFLIVEAVVTLSWLAVGVLFCRRSRRGSKSPWMGFTLVPVACQELLRLLTVIRPTPWMFAAGTMLLVAAGVAIAGAASTLHFVLRDKDRSLLRLSVDLRASESRIEGERERREEQLHDVRSALAAIRCANGTLHKYAARLDERTKAVLDDALTKELGRLEGLVDPTVSNPHVDFRLDELLEPLVAAEVNQGSEVLLHVGDLAAHGRPFDTAAVVQNLIVNARRYAPGSVVSIHASQVGGRVTVQVEDSGPGIPEREHASVFERGVRGSTSAGVEGTGLGLFVSRRLMVEQHGSLKLRAGAAGGACFVLDLPAADSRIDPRSVPALQLPDVALATGRP
ncbi:MAG: signal transduction histidine kinase, partial [Mycobacterium sp.]|nr:signal transduction histidine kinase [Mycobacterium sp.]